MKILIVEDEPALSDSMTAYLGNEGFLCAAAHNYSSAAENIRIYDYSCALIDIMLPDGNGLELVQLIKSEQPNCGIIIVSAKNALDDKVKGLEYGADDYLTKPFHLSELNARLKSVIRRRNFNGSNEISTGDIRIDTAKREVTVCGSVLTLTRREYDILLFLVSNKGKVLTKEAITEHIWGDDSNSYDNLDFVYTHIKNLRKKLTDNGGGDDIQSVYGVGYKFLVK